MQADAGVGQSGSRILLVDDSLSALMLVSQVLEADGFEVIQARSGKEALGLFPKVCPDLVVLDILMPEMNGLDVCRHIRRLGSSERVPILFLTGDMRPETQLEAIEAGGDDLIHKPSLQAELLIRVRSLLRLQRLQVDLMKERDALKTLQEQKEHLFHFIIHDLKGPLQGFQSTLELLSFKSLGEDSRKYLERLVDMSTTMGHMIQDLLDVTRATRVGLQADMAAFPLGAMSRLWVRDVSYLAGRKAQVLQNEIPEDLVAWGDEQLLGRCLFNLLTNACKYGPEGGTVRVAAVTSHGRLRLMVDDQGPGIPVGMREQIFEPFFRLDRDKEQARASSGLGLAFCRLVAEAHGGRLWVDALSPSGARFCLEWDGFRAAIPLVPATG